MAIRKDDRKKAVTRGVRMLPGTVASNGERTYCPMVGDTIDKSVCITRSTRREALCKESGCGG